MVPTEVPRKLTKSCLKELPSMHEPQRLQPKWLFLASERQMVGYIILKKDVTAVTDKCVLKQVMLMNKT
jgi:hypothetical protein